MLAMEALPPCGVNWPPTCTVPVAAAWVESEPDSSVWPLKRVRCDWALNSESSCCNSALMFERSEPESVSFAPSTPKLAHALQHGGLLAHAAFRRLHHRDAVLRVAHGLVGAGDLRLEVLADARPAASSEAEVMRKPDERWLSAMFRSFYGVREVGDAHRGS